jgi:hypothetical protein
MPNYTFSPNRAFATAALAVAILHADARAEAQNSSSASRDTSFDAMQRRGKIAMGVDQYTSVHRFDDLADGGRIELQRASDDPAGVRTIRTHLNDIAKAFGTGDFSTPELVHASEVPGVDVMVRKRGVIHYAVRELPRGGVVVITTSDPEALRAVPRFLAFQRGEHHATGHDMHAPH